MYLFVRIDEEGNIAQRDEVTEGEKQLAAEGSITLLKFDRRLARIYFYDSDDEWSELEMVDLDGDCIDDIPIHLPDTGERRREEDSPAEHSVRCNSHRGGACNCK